MAGVVICIILGNHSNANTLSIVENSSSLQTTVTRK